MKWRHATYYSNLVAYDLYFGSTKMLESHNTGQTRAIQEIEDGKLPEWDLLQAPEIAVNYWQMPEGQRTMKDLLLYIRADEAKHREVNHTLSNLSQTSDPNPYQSRYHDPSKIHPTKGMENLKETGWERKEVF